MTPWILAAGLACSGGDPSTGDSDSAQPITDTIPETVLPTGDRVLLYYGHGGATPRSFDHAIFDEAMAWLAEETGLDVEHTDDWPEGGFEDIRAMLFIDPGSEDDDVFGSDQVDQLKDALAAGTRLAFLSSYYGTCAHDTIDPVLEALGVGMRFTGTHVSVGSIKNMAPYRAHQITNGIDEVWFGEPCVIVVDGETVLFIDDGEAYTAIQQIGYGGEVVLMGDYRWLDDSSLYDDVSNRQLWRNLAWVLPEGD